MSHKIPQKENLPPNEKRQIVFVSGLSGAGMSSALKNLEDFGFEVFDNIPLSMIDQLLESDTDKTSAPIAFGLDSRTRHFSPPDIIQKKQDLEQSGQYSVSLCFVTCTDDVIQNRYSLTRRPHPLAREQSIHTGISIERTWLNPLRDHADMTIDTTDMSVHDLKRLLDSRYNTQNKEGRIFVTIMSFGFKNATPREADMMLDVRFLSNPHWEKKLRPLTGQEEEVKKYIEKDDAFEPFITKTKDLLDLILPRYEVEGKSYVTIAVGCTGGKHRSVHVAETLHDYIKGLKYPTSLRHRDL